MTESESSPEDDPSLWCGERVEPGTHASLTLNLSESYTSRDLSVPLFVWRGIDPGPTVLISAAVHGDEINGTGTIRHLLRERPFELVRGTLVFLPVVNLLGFERHTRYMPDRRDLNRAFPGSPDGSLAGRIAWSLFDRVVRRCDYGIDLHTAAVRRTNFPNVRADLSNPKLLRFARAFGAELLVDNKGPSGSLRREACEAGCAMLLLEAGEAWKVEPTVVEYSVHGITNCLRYLKMVEGRPQKPEYRFETDTTKWIRADAGGFLEFHVAPGSFIEKGAPIATNTDLLGQDQDTILSPRTGIVLGMTTMPAVAPGDPICHVAYSKRGVMRKIARAVDEVDEGSLHARVREDLATNLMVVEVEDEDQNGQDAEAHAASSAEPGAGPDAEPGAEPDAESGSPADSGEPSDPSVPRGS